MNARGRSRDRRSLPAVVPTSLLALLLATGLSSCGGGGGGGAEGGTADEERIENAIELTATSADPATCQRYSTLKFMEQTTHSEGSKAEESCEERAGEAQAESVTVSDVRVEGDGASANVAFVGGNYDGQTMAVKLVRKGEGWRLDEITGFVEFDPAKSAAALARRLEQVTEASSAEVRCITAEWGKLSQPEVEKVMVAGEFQRLLKIARGCEASTARRRAHARERRAEEARELEEIEEELAPEIRYPHAVEQNFLSSCLQSSGGNFAVCECELASIEERYSVEELRRAEADLASGEAQKIVESATADCV